MLFYVPRDIEQISTAVVFSSGLEKSLEAPEIDTSSR
jgi:hypothetical protein